MGPVGFDLDMTLINSRPAILASFGEVARETATAIDLDAVDRRLGIKLDDELAFWFPPDRSAAAAEIYRRHYVRLAERMTTLLPGAHEALAAVRAAGERVVIITAKHPISVGPSLRSTASRSMAVPVSRATSANEARMAGRELISVMSRSKPTGPIPPPSQTLRPLRPATRGALSTGSILPARCDPGAGTAARSG